MDIRVAQREDTDSVLRLHARYQIDTIHEDDKKDGFVTSSFSKDQLEQLISQENGLFVAVEQSEVVAYVMAGSWAFWSPWPVQAVMIEKISAYACNGEQLSVENSYQYGPVCVDKSFRGSGLLKQIFDFALDQMSTRYRYLVTFVNNVNPRSLAAHTRKLGLEELGTFGVNGNTYSWLVCSTQRDNQ